MNVLKTALLVVAGVGAGLATGLLTAPKSGKETRNDLADEMDATKKALEEAATQKLEEAKKILNDTVQTQAENGINAIHKMKKAVMPG